MEIGLWNGELVGIGTGYVDVSPDNERRGTSASSRSTRPFSSKLAMAPGVTVALNYSGSQVYIKLAMFESLLQGSKMNLHLII